MLCTTNKIEFGAVLNSAEYLRPALALSKREFKEEDLQFRNQVYPYRGPDFSWYQTSIRKSTQQSCEHYELPGFTTGEG